jgi:hypothetical protein
LCLTGWQLRPPFKMGGFRGEDLNVIFYQNMPNLHNRYKSAERKISQKYLEYMLNYSFPLYHFRTFNVFLAHLAKGHVSFCHHLASVVVGPFVVRHKLSHLNLLWWNPLNQIKPNLTGMVIGYFELIYN